MPRGQVPKPAALKKLHGSTEPRDEPVAYGDLVVANACPKHFTPSQREIWEYTLANSPRNVLKRIDSFVLEAWVVAVSLHRAAVEAVNALGDDIMVETPNGHHVQSPYMAVINRQAFIMKTMATEFGFTPVARARLGSGGHTTIAGEALVKPGVYTKDGPRESIEDYLDRASRTATKH
jgi:P27 family predicted phage terminase small subunit